MGKEDLIGYALQQRAAAEVAHETIMHNRITSRLDQLSERLAAVYDLQNLILQRINAIHSTG